MPPQRIIMIRHAEKDDHPVHLSAKGRIRAQGLIDYFKRENHPAGLGKIDIIMAQRQAHKHKSDRSAETVLPLAEAMNITPFIEYKRKQLNKIVKVLTSEICEGKTVLLCMQHEALIKLADFFGFDVRTWSLEPMRHNCRDAYDVTWVLSFTKYEIGLRVFQQFDVSDHGQLIYKRSPDTATYECMLVMKA